MEDIAYESLSESELTGWYYVARIRAVKSILRAWLPSPRSKEISVLDVGCGTGGSTSHLQEFGQVSGLEPSEKALNLLKKNFPTIDVREGDVATVDETFRDSLFDVVTILGVLYHRNVKSPREALKKIAKLQNAGGLIIWNEAAYPILYRHHDKTVHGERRFYPSEMKGMLCEAGYTIVSGSHLLSWAFPIALCLALYERWKGHSENRESNESADHKPLPYFINKLLEHITFFENLIARKFIWFPVGVSYLVVAKKSERTN